MDDKSIIHHIQHLVDEEHQLDQKGDRSPDDHKRYQDAQSRARPVLGSPRQRRARREFGEDPDQAESATRRSSRATSSRPAAVRDPL